MRGSGPAWPVGKLAHFGTSLSSRSFSQNELWFLGPETGPAVAHDVRAALGRLRSAGLGRRQDALQAAGAQREGDDKDDVGGDLLRAVIDGAGDAQRAGVATASDDPFRLASLAWSAVHRLVTLRIDRPNFPWPPSDGMIDDALRRLLLMTSS
jgi:hypothetical protein